MLSKTAQRALMGWEAHGPRTIAASFRTKKKRINVNIIQCYAPTNDSDEERKDEFYDRLQTIIQKYTGRDITIVMGDLNAKIGGDNRGYETIMGQHGLGEMNENGERLADLCANNNLVIGGSVFPHKRIHKATWVSRDLSTENQIHNFCITKKFRRSLQDVRARRGADIASDHHLLVAKVQLKLRRNWTGEKNQQQKFNTALLRDPITAKQLNNSCTRAQKVKAQAQYREAEKRVKRSIKKDETNHIEALAVEAEEAARCGNMKDLYATTEKLSGKTSKPQRPVKDKEGKPIIGEEGQRRRWMEHFEDPLNRPAPQDPPHIQQADRDLEMDLSTPSKEETRTAIKNLKNGKVAGPDSIPAEDRHRDHSRDAPPSFQEDLGRGKHPIRMERGLPC